MKQPSTPKQRQLIKIMQRQIGIDDDAYRDLLEDRFKVRSSTKLSYLQAGIMIEDLKKKGPGVYKPGKRKSNRMKRHGAFQAAKASGKKIINLASIREIDKINKLADLIEWRVEGGLYGWMRKRFKINKVRTAQDAYLVIEGLKKLFENQMKKKHGSDWKNLNHEDPEVRKYLFEHRPSPKLRKVVISGNRIVSTSRRAEG